MLRWLLRILVGSPQLNVNDTSTWTLMGRIEALESRFDFLQLELRRLRGRLTGGIRYREELEELEEGDDDDQDDDRFPDEEYERLRQERRANNG